MRQTAIADLMVQANFGRTALNRRAIFIASHYRLVLALLIGGLLISHLLLTGALIPLLVTLVCYAVYVWWRLHMSHAVAARFYTPRVQFWRAQLGIWGVTILLIVLAQRGSTGSLWVLYLSALLLVSRYCEHQRLYIGVALEVALLAALVHLLELNVQRPDLIMQPRMWEIVAGEMLGRAFAVIIPSFLVHYLARASITTRHGAKMRDDIISTLMRRALFEPDPATLWCDIREACRAAVNAVTSEICLYNDETKQLQPINRVRNGYTPRRAIPLTSQALLEQAIRQNRVIVGSIVSGNVEIAAPIRNYPDEQRPPLAVVRLHCHVTTKHELRATCQFLEDLLDHIRPISVYASTRRWSAVPGRANIHALHVEQTPAQGFVGHHTLSLQGVFDDVLDTLCTLFGFSFATISLVDIDRWEICTVASKNIPEAWASDAHHSLDGYDIQASVLRTRKTVTTTEWDERFDKQMWDKYNHADLVRVFVPLDGIGTIETGFNKQQRSDIPAEMVKMLEGYARNVAIAIQNAQLYEREQQHATMLGRLHDVGYTLHTSVHTRGEQPMFVQIGQAALDALEADLVIFVPHVSGEQTPVIVAAHDFTGGSVSVEIYQAAMHQVVEQNTAYYQSNAQQAIGIANIASFAGVPLQVQGEVLGVLLVNYCRRRYFGTYERQVIDIFAQQVSAIMTSQRLVREQERLHLERELHDTVKSSVRGMIWLSQATTDIIKTDPDRAGEHLHEVRRAGWSILSDINMIIRDLALPEHQQPLKNLIEEQLQHIARRDDLILTLDLEGLPLLPMMVARTVLLVIREAVINAVEHGKAPHVHVQVDRHGTLLNVTVTDDGGGFVFDPSYQSYRGLRYMHTRIHEIGGHMEVRAAALHGTIITMTLPLA